MNRDELIEAIGRRLAECHGETFELGEEFHRLCAEEALAAIDASSTHRVLALPKQPDKHGTMSRYDWDFVVRLADVMLQAQLDNRDGKRDLSAEEIIEEILTAADNSGRYWVAPWKMTDPMHGAYNATYHSSAGATWASLRDACLAERREGEEQ